MPDLILTDVMMPEMDGYELCRAIRKSDILNHIPIIIISARSDEPDRLAGLATGADAYLVKPFNTEELQLQIRKLLEQRRILREKYARQMQVRKHAPSRATRSESGVHDTSAPNHLLRDGRSDVQLRDHCK